MADLIDRDRALRNLNNLTPTAAEATLIDGLLTAVSRGVESYCGRAFAETRYDELYAGTPHAELVLRAFPLLRVVRVAGSPTEVLRVTNTGAANQRATVRVTDTGLTLAHVASGVETSADVAFAGAATLDALAAAVAALGNGWTAEVPDGIDGLRASTDLRAQQGALNAQGGGAGLRLHVVEPADVEIDAERGLLRRRPGWPGGPDAWRVIYDAGYASVPDDVQEACAQWVAVLFWQAKRDPGLASEQVPAVVTRVPLDTLPVSTRLLLQPYRTVRI
jgi:hypothetical protein